MPDGRETVLSAIAGGPATPGEPDVIWWSFTKTLIAAGVLRLAEAGRLDLDRDLRAPGTTPRALLQQRAGLRDYGGLPSYQAAVAAAGPPWSEAELLDEVSDVPVPGLPWTYSNVGYMLLRRCLEQSCGTDLATALGDLVLRPLGLTRARVAQTTGDLAATALPPPAGYDPGWVYHGTVIGPPSEAAAALGRLMDRQLLSPATLDLMCTPLPLGGALPGRPWTATGYGLGLMIGSMADPAGGPDIRVVGHSAGGPGSVGAVYHAPATGRTAAAFAAGDDGGIPERTAVRLVAGGRADGVRTA
ncbi:serine hydrolase domain-containing protein [Methylobrevis albus]|uniref:Beta-lactamase family protein n=1 Tax=Methylobrevis albus TaxID=2793297 RepID=A0A931I5G7_9HYPH|nr:serine hydrolase domain-containing protein [Methylobrevis albus]MBH0239188.1 beta-lactamase family protein [Methylobrevis albus]